MDGARLASVALLAISVTLVTLGVAASCYRVARVARDRRRAALTERARGLVLEWLHRGEAKSPELPKAVGQVLDTVAAALLRKLRGEDRAAIVRLLETRGTIEAARRTTRRRGSVRRARAAHLLGVAGYSAALDDVARLLRHRRPEVRSVAARALGRMGTADAVPHLLEALEERRLPEGTATVALLHLGPAAEPALRAALGHRSPAIRAVAASLLGFSGTVSASRDLTEMLTRDGDAGVRACCACALGRIGAPGAVGPLSDCLAPDVPEAIAGEAARALGTIGGTGAVPALVRALAFPDHEVARAAAHALVAMGPVARDRLVRLAGGTDVRSAYAREALTRAAAAGGRARR